MHVEELWRFPVKSLQGERLDRAAIVADGLAGDRRFAYSLMPRRDCVDRSACSELPSASARLGGDDLEITPSRRLGRKRRRRAVGVARPSGDTGRWLREARRSLRRVSRRRGRSRAIRAMAADAANNRCSHCFLPRSFLVRIELDRQSATGIEVSCRWRQTTPAGPTGWPLTGRRAAPRDLLRYHTVARHTPARRHPVPARAARAARCNDEKIGGLGDFRACSKRSRSVARAMTTPSGTTIRKSAANAASHAAQTIVRALADQATNNSCRARTSSGQIDQRAAPT